ncbi:hypothetical protein EDB84DRAFT_1636759 [Lactarius hengduanensis]|nr:hypothetical protein EDB84DRAFT_1636759 [Lactarius hengduanensis]
MSPVVVIIALCRRCVTIAVCRVVVSSSSSVAAAVVAVVAIDLKIAAVVAASSPFSSSTPVANHDPHSTGGPRPRKGEDDGLRQAPFLVPSCSPSLRCCGTCDDDDASPATSDPGHDGPDSVAYYPVGSTSSTPSLSPSSSPSPQLSSVFNLIASSSSSSSSISSSWVRETIQFVHVEYYFNELNEFDHPSSSTSSTPTSSYTTGSSAPSQRPQSIR